MDWSILSVLIWEMIVLVAVGLIIDYGLKYCSNKKKEVAFLEMNKKLKEIDKLSDEELIEEIKTIRFSKIRKKSGIEEISTIIFTTIFGVFSAIYIAMGKNLGRDISTEISISFPLLLGITMIFAHNFNNVSEKCNTEISREQEKLLIDMELQLQKKYQEKDWEKTFMNYLDENTSKEKESSFDLELKINSKSTNSSKFKELSN